MRIRQAMADLERLSYGDRLGEGCEGISSMPIKIFQREGARFLSGAHNGMRSNVRKHKAQEISPQGEGELCTEGGRSLEQLPDRTWGVPLWRHPKSSWRCSRGTKTPRPAVWGPWNQGFDGAKLTKGFCRGTSPRWGEARVRLGWDGDGDGVSRDEEMPLTGPNRQG